MLFQIDKFKLRYTFTNGSEGYFLLLVVAKCVCLIYYFNDCYLEAGIVWVNAVWVNQ